MNDKMNEILDKLRLPFHPSNITFKPGTVKGDRAIAMAYADLRAYMNRLDEVCGSDWSVAYEPWGEDRIICRLTIGGVTRSSTGEMAATDEKQNMGGTVAEAQAFKRASAMFGLGRYLYNLPTGWADFDPATKKFTANAKFKLTGILLQHYRHATGNDGSSVEQTEQAPDDEPEPTSGAALDEFHALGLDIYGDNWQKVCRRNVNRISGGQTQDATKLSAEQIQKLIGGMRKLKDGRVPMRVVA